MKEGIDTSCRKCGAAPPVTPKKVIGLPFTLTGYRCKQCDHVNDLRNRKPRKERRKL